MKIALNAHLLSGRLGYRTAGIHGYIYNLLAHLPAACPPGWSLTAYVGRGTAHTFDGVRMIRSRLDTASPARRVLWEQVFQPAQVAGYDLYHALAFVLPVALRTPSVVTVYDLSFLHYPQVLTPARRLYLRLLTAHSCQRARRVIAISHSTADDLHRSLGIPRERIDVAPCGYDTALFRPLPPGEVEAFRRAQGLPDRFWLFVGTLEPRKNLPTLLRAYARLPRGERPPLIIGGGKGWLYDEIFATVEQLDLADDVRFVGFIPAESLALWYNSAQVFVYPSVFEGFGLPVLEAMACGTPVIVSAASSLPEVVGSAGLQVAPHDIDAWESALHHALTSAEWRATAREQGFRSASRYRWSLTAEQTVDSYRRATN